MTAAVPVPARSAAWPRIGLFTTGHFTNDLYGNMLPILMPILTVQLGFSLTAAAFLFTVYSLTSSVVQPYLGHLADRSGVIWMSAAGCILSALGGALLGIAPNYAVLLALAVIGGIGTAAYHPQAAAMVVSFAGPHRSTVMALYLLGGSIGFAIGPLMITWVVDNLGIVLTPILVIPGLLIAALLYGYAPRDWNAHRGKGISLRRVIADNRDVLGLLVLIVAVRAVAQTGLTFFLPFYFAREGLPPADYAKIIAAFLLVGAFGGIVGAYISDHWASRQTVIVTELLLSTVFMLLMIFSSGLLVWIWAALAGITLLGSWPLLTVRGQELMPANIGMASGLMLGLSISLGGIAVAPLGAVADQIGVTPVLIALAFFPPIAALLVPRLPRRGDPAWQSPVAQRAETSGRLGPPGDAP